MREVIGRLLCCIPLPAHGFFGSRRLGISFAIVFFVASSAASAAYLTVSEIFPLELRAFAIAIFYSLGTLIGGVGAPILFGFLIATNSRMHVALGYGLGAALMIAGAVCEKLIGVEAGVRAWNLFQSRCRAPDAFSR